MKKNFVSVIDVHCASPMAVRRNFSSGDENNILLIRFRLLTMQRKLTCEKALYPFCAIKKMPSVRATVVNSAPSKKIYVEQMFVLERMNVLIHKTELAEF